MTRLRLALAWMIVAIARTVAVLVLSAVAVGLLAMVATIIWDMGWWALLLPVAGLVTLVGAVGVVFVVYWAESEISMKGNR